MKHRSLYILISLACLLSEFPVLLWAQKDLQEQYIELKARISELEDAGIAGDSLDGLYSRLLEILRQGDQLKLYFDAAWDWQANYFDESEHALGILDSSLQHIWRKPTEKATLESLMWIYINRGYHLFQSGRVLEAVKAYEEAARLHEKYHFEGFPSADYLYLPLGAHYTRLGDNEKARAVYLKALQDPSVETNYETLAGIYNNIGISYWNAGDNEEAIRWYRKGLTLAHLPKGKKGLLLSALAQSLAEMGHSREALKRVGQAVKELEAWFHEEEGNTYAAAQLAGAYTRKGELLAGQEPAASAQAFEKALHYSRLAYPSGYHREIAKIFIKRGQIRLEKGESQKALGDFDAALKSLLPHFKPQKHGQTLPDSTQLYAENALFEALEGKADALLSLPQPDAEKLQTALQAHQLADVVQNLLYQSYRYSSSKLLLQEQGRRRSEKAIALCYRLFELTQDDEYIFMAFEIAEQHKARLLRESLHENLVRSHAGDSELFRQKTELQKQQAFIERQMRSQPEGKENTSLQQQHDQIVEELYQINLQIAEKYPRYANSIKELSTSLQKLSKQLPPQTGFLSYFFGQNSLYTWLILPEGREVAYHFSQTPLTSNELKEKVNTLFDMLSRRDQLSGKRASFSQLAEHTYEQLYPEVLRKTLPPNMLIIPDGLLYYLPFEILLTEEADTAALWQDWPFLLEEQQIQYAYSAGVWLEQKAMQSQAPERLLVVAPSFSPNDPRALPPLSQDDYLTELAGAEIMSEEAASLSAFRQMAARYRLIHLHTHALSEGVPRIELSDSSLFLSDIYALPLQSELVVLSACQTGSGEVLEGEGAMSLARAFSYAGTQNLIASLWKVNEKSTARLFDGFYQYLEKGCSPGQSLRRAKLDYLHDPSVENWEKSPYYWAAFIPIGYNRQEPRHWWWLALTGACALGLAALLRRKNKKNAMRQRA